MVKLRFTNVTRLTTVGKYSTSGRSSSPVPGSTYGVISNVASVHAIVSHNTLSAKKRPGQILLIAVTQWMEKHRRRTNMYPPSAKSENEIARIIVPDSRSRNVLRVRRMLSEDLAFDLIPVPLGIENFRILEVLFISRHLPVSLSLTIKSPNGRKKGTNHMFGITRDPFGIVQSSYFCASIFLWGNPDN